MRGQGCPVRRPLGLQGRRTVPLLKVPGLRGLGLGKALTIFADLREKLGVPVLLGISHAVCSPAIKPETADVSWSPVPVVVNPVVKVLGKPVLSAPFHAMARRLLLPAFAPKPIAAYEPFTRELCNELLDATAGKSVVDAAVEYAQDIPLRVIVRMLGFPQEDADIFRRFIHMVLEEVDTPQAQRIEQIESGELDAYIDARIQEHIAEPRDDLTTFAVTLPRTAPLPSVQ